MKWKNLSFLTYGFVLSTTMSFIFTSIANANSSTNLNLSSLPESGQTAQDFVPAGWKLQDKVDGDINNDRQLDTVLTLIQVGTENDELELLFQIQHTNHQEIRDLLKQSKIEKKLSLVTVLVPLPRRLICD